MEVPPLQLSDHVRINVPEFTDRAAMDALFSTLYSELHQMAKRQRAFRWSPENLGATTLLHEAYLDVAGRDGALFPDRARFMGYMARVIRGLIIDHARRNRSLKRGGDFALTAQDIEMIGRPDEARELSMISDALDELAKIEPELAEVVDLKFFCGFSFGEIASIQKLSERTVQRKWEKARIFLHRNVSTSLSF
jgi:RNA polymerase sigma factor (TIGR02999 family)